MNDVTAEPQAAYWELVFNTDQTRADAPKIPLATMFEFPLPSGGVHRNVAYLSRLNDEELALINTVTYPEMKEVGEFLRERLAAANKSEEGWESLRTTFRHLRALELCRFPIINDEKLAAMQRDPNSPEVMKFLPRKLMALFERYESNQA
jgi:hypothetical protein